LLTWRDERQQSAGRQPIDSESVMYFDNGTSERLGFGPTHHTNGKTVTTGLLGNQ
jgi:hypothetical protein